MVSKKEKLKEVQKIGIVKQLKVYNNLCKPCKIKSMAAVRRGGNAVKTIYKKYCNDCRTKVEELYK